MRQASERHSCRGSDQCEKRSPRPGDQFRKAFLIQAVIGFHTVFGTRLELLQIPARLGDANYRNFELPALCQLLQSGKNLLVRKVAGAPKNTSASDGI
jgi:hypothetical protein